MSHHAYGGPVLIRDRCIRNTSNCKAATVIAARFWPHLGEKTGLLPGLGPWEYQEFFGGKEARVDVALDGMKGSFVFFIEFERYSEPYLDSLGRLRSRKWVQHLAPLWTPGMFRVLRTTSIRPK